MNCCPWATSGISGTMEGVEAVPSWQKAHVHLAFLAVEERVACFAELAPGLFVVLRPVVCTIVPDIHNGPWC